MKEVDRRVTALAERQHGVVGRDQARALGLSSSNLSYRLRAGHLIEFGTSTLRVPGTAPSWYSLLMAGLLDLGPEALITGRAGARLLGLDGFATEAADFLVPRSLRHRTTIGTVTSSSDIRPGDKVVIDGFPVTSATRTIVELLRIASADEVGSALDSACRNVRKVGQRRNGRELAGAPVPRGARLPAPVLRQRYQLEGVGVARVDFEYPLWGLVVEVGGQRGYLSLDERRRHARRRNALQLESRTIYFFARNDVVDEPAYVVRTIAAALGGPRPCLIPTGGAVLAERVGWGCKVCDVA